MNTARWLYLALIVLLSPLAVAQPADRHSSAAPDEPEGLIHLDVLVINQRGYPVSGLKAADFTVLDNGHPEKIVSFHAYGGMGAAPDPPVSVTLVLDTLQLPFTLASQERQSVEAFLRRHGGHLAQPMTILTLTESGLSRVGVASTEGNRLAESIAHNRVTSWTGRNNNLSAQIDRTSNQSQVPALGAGLVNIPVVNDLPGEAALKALGAIATAERRQSGRKLLIWVGPGWGVGSGVFGHNPQGAGSGVNPEEAAETNKEKQTLFDRIVWFSTLLRVARITLDNFSEGETTGVNNDDGQLGVPLLNGPAAMPFPWYSVHPAVSPQELSPTSGQGVANLNRKVLALESGGRSMPRSSDLARQLEDCVHETNTFYSLTFNPAPAAHFDEYHTLGVNIREPGLTAHTNTSYYDQPYYLDTPDPAIRKITVAQLGELLRGARSESDGDMARQLSDLELTERASDDEVASWTAELRGKKARQVLLALADASAFLDPPPAEIPGDAPPDEDAQRQMISLAANYLNTTIPRLPNFFARRTSVGYEETPPFYKGGGRFTAAEPLHAVGSSKTTVLYRDGAEVVDAKTGRRGKEDQSLTTYGTFGPVLGAVKGALADSGALTWSRWEKDAAGARRAVFRYAVPTAASGYKTGGCCLPDGDGTMAFVRMTGYHGEIAIDPGSGAVLRVELEADFNGFVPMGRADVMVAYGPVNLGSKTYICPVHSVGIWRARSVNTLLEWNNTQGFLTWGPYATKLNDFRYDDYHLFRAESRILSGFSPQTGEGNPDGSAQSTTEPQSQQ